MKSTNLQLLTACLLLHLAQAPALGGGEKEIAALATCIDQRIAAAWDKDLKPVARADDAEFFRRVHLDLTGHIPSIVEIRDFLDDPRPEKRRLWVERMLRAAPDDPSYRDAYSKHFANVWRTWWLTQTNQQALSQQTALEVWLEQRLKSNVGYDRLIRDLLTLDPVLSSPRGSLDGSPTAFYLANDLQPESLAASSARLFLGVKLECAQCHAHPFAHWTREQFWEYAAFFADVPPLARPNLPASQPDPRSGIKIMGTDKVVKARFLDGKAPQWKNDKTRPTLADWMTANDNPFFARAAVNRLWAYFFGIGLVDLDGPAEEENTSHLALLDDMARAFVASRYDLQFLIRAIVASQAYQRTSVVAPEAQPDRKRFARMPLRGLSPEQLFDSLAVATECSETAPVEPAELFIGGRQSPRAQFLAKFPNQNQPADYQTSILQALYLMNNSFIATQTSVRKNQTLATLAEQRTSNASKVESLYLVVLSRKPRPEESARFVAYLDAGEAKSALSDIFWILLNSPEFILNH